MQKKLIALAIAGLSGAAFAQSNVTVYGEMNMAYTNMSSNTTAGTPNRTGIDSLDSRVGFKGEEALGGGLKAVFTAEFRVNGDTAGAGSSAGAAGTTAGASGLGVNARQTFVGIGGSWGTITAGRQYTPYFEAAAALDPFGAATANVASVANSHPIAAVARANNSLKYVGAFDAMGGKVIVAGLYGFSEDTTVAPAAIADSKVTNWKLAYAGGPVLVGITGIKLADNAGGTALARGTDTKGLALGGTYNFGVVKLHYIYDKVTVEPAAAAKIVDSKIQTFGLSAPMGAHTFKLAYTQIDDRLAGNMDGKHTGIGYAYALSKRTSLIANYGHISSSGGAKYALLPAITGPNLSGINPGGYQTSYQLGMAHAF